MEYYNIRLTEIARQQIIRFYLYILNTLMNPFAADSFLQDANNTMKRLSYMADGLPICEDKELAKYGYRIIHFKKHSYKMLYRLKGRIAYIDAVYHNLQQIKIPIMGEII